MSFLSDVFHGNFSNLGNDLAPSNVFSDFGSDATKALSNPLVDAGIAASIALPFIAPEIGAGLGLAGATATGAADAAAPALGFAGDVGAASGDADLASWLASPGGASLGADTSGALSLAPTGAGATAAPALADAGAGAWPAAADLGAPGAGAATGSTPLDISTAAATGGASAAATGAGATAPGGLSGAISSIGGGLKTAAPFIGLGSLGYNLFQGYEQKKQLNALNASEAQNAQTLTNTATAENNAAQPLLAQGNVLTSYLTSNTLPAGLQEQVTQQLKSAKAAIIQGYASRGQSTNPEQNSALAQDLANVDAQGLTLKTNMEQTLEQAGVQLTQQANQLLQAGASATDMSSQIPIMISKLNSALNAQTAQAISSFAASLNSGGGKVTISAPPGTNVTQGT